MEVITRRVENIPARCSSLGSSEMMANLYQGILKVLSRWNGLQMAVQNEWGGRDSKQKSEQLARDIFSWFRQTKEPLCAEDLETLLHESMLFTFNTEIEDGSIEEVAEQLMITHEECLHGSQI